MITNDIGLKQTVGLIGNMYRSLCSLHEETLPKNRKLFAVMSETPIDYMRRLIDEADAYIETMKPRFPERDEEASNDAALSSAGKSLEEIRAERRIRTDAGLKQTIELIGNMYRSLCSLHEETLPKNRKLFAVMSETPIDYMRRLIDEADEYIETMKPHFSERDEEASNDAAPPVASEEAEAPRRQERELSARA